MGQVSEAKRLKSYLKRVGVSSDAAAVYIELFRVGPTTALKISRALNIPRTQVYRELDSLKALSLVSADKLSYGTLFRALPLDNLESLLRDRRAVTEQLSNELASVAQSMQIMAGSSGPKATVRNYYGIAGLRQANWNLTKASKEFRVFETSHLSERFDQEFVKRCRERILERKLLSFDLTNHKRHSVKDLEPFDPSKVKLRYIDPKILDIKFEMYIYDEVVTLLDYSEQQRMAIEICHPNLSTMMRQLFDAMWMMGEDVVFAR
jgi:sugar-specific transcriptional regulator TrmB